MDCEMMKSETVGGGGVKRAVDFVKLKVDFELFKLAS